MIIYYIFGSTYTQFLLWLTWPTFDVAVHLIVSGVYWFAAIWIHSVWCDPVLSTIWASYQIREIAGSACAGNSRNISPPPQISNPDMHHGTCVTHVPWCMPGSLTSNFLWSRWRGKHSRHSRRMRNPQFCVSGKRPMAGLFTANNPLYIVMYYGRTVILRELYLAPFCQQGLTFIPAWISKCIHYKVWYGITFPFRNINGAAIYV